MKKQKLIILLILFLSINLGIGNNVLAAQRNDVPDENQEGAESKKEYLDSYEALLRNSYIRSASSSLSISGNTATCTGYCSKYASANGGITIYVYLQKLSGGSWTTVNSGSSTYTGTYGTKTVSATISKGTYRSRVSCWVNGENIIVNSSSKTY